MTDMEQKSEPLDVDAALNRAMGDKSFLSTLLEQFVAMVPTSLDVLKKALADNDGETFQKEAHRLKGAASNLSVDAVAAVSLQLEKMGQKNDFVDAEKTLEDLGVEFERFQIFLSQVDWS